MEKGSGKREFPRGGAHEPLGSWEPRVRRRATFNSRRPDKFTAAWYNETMNPVRNQKLMKKMITKRVELTAHHRLSLMKKALCF